MAMEVESSMPLPAPLTKANNVATILCCECGAPIDGTVSGALCEACLRLSVDISSGIQREATLHTCRDCDRWMSPPNQWVMAAPESRELLALCLRKLRGLSKARIIDASFIWTEPHSRRVRVKITIQQEVGEGTILQQTFDVEYVVANHQCPDCAKSFTHNTWRASVQVRQKVPHKRTFLYLEQLILKSGAHKDAINIKEVHEGIDFFFAARNSAEKFVDFLTSSTPVRVQKSQQLISMDTHTSKKSYKFSFSVELIPICKDDLVALPLKLANAMGSIAPLTICHRIGTAVNLIDPNTLQTADLSCPVYWRTPFASLASARNLTSFVIMDIEPIRTPLSSQTSNNGGHNGRFKLAEATIRRSSDLGSNDHEYTVRTHLGHLLHPGDQALGYHLSQTNFNNPQLEAILEHHKWGGTVPDVILVKKEYPRRAKAKKSGRNWKLKRMAREADEKDAKRGKNGVEDREEADYEMFLRDVEEDEEMRGVMDLYRARRAAEGQKEGEAMEGVETHSDGGRAAAEDGLDEEEDDSDDDDDDDENGLQIPMDQLRDEFEDMKMNEDGSPG